MASITGRILRKNVFSKTITQKANHGTAATAGEHKDGWKMWRNLSLFGAFPAIALCLVNVILEHQKAHGHERPPFVKYEYMYVRTKRFPWGDGQHSFFHNPHVNALPDGYED